MREAYAILFAKSGLGNVHTELGKLTIRERGFGKAARAHLLEAITLNSKDLDAIALLSGNLALQLSAWQFAASKLRRAAIVVNSKDFKLAYDLARRGLELSRSSPFLEIFGILQDVKEEHAQARQCFREAGRQRADPYWRLLMFVSYGMDGNDKAAAAQINTAMKEGADNWLTSLYRGQSFFRTGHYLRALAIYQRLKRSNGYFMQLTALWSDALYFAGFPGKAAIMSLRTAIYVRRISGSAFVLHVLAAGHHFSIATWCSFSRMSWRVMKYFHGLRDAW